MEPFRPVSGPAAPLLMDDVNTDQVAPATSAFAPDYAALLFARWRADPDFVLSREPFRRARILVTGNNFGCGSSRESAVWTLQAFGIGTVVARSFADSFRENCLKNGLLPVTFEGASADAFERAVVANDGAGAFAVDLQTQTIVAPDGTVYPFTIPPADRDTLLRGLDDIGMTLENIGDIERWETRTRTERPWAAQLSR
jgi:3-isopropylmalate/(R)-2-methylmalate dehydratase small subunit